MTEGDLRAVYGSIPPLQYEALVLRHRHGMGWKRIRNHLGMSSHTQARRLVEKGERNAALVLDALDASAARTRGDSRRGES